MNQDQVKEQLLRLESEVPNFTVTMSGKSSKKVDGLYYPDRCEIILHNQNFADDNQMMYTAIHEFAHHIQFAQSNGTISNRSHTKQFWNLFHRLLYRAEEEGVYRNVFNEVEDFRVLTEKLKGSYLAQNGHLMKEMGELLMKAMELCQMYHASFDDYVDRILGLHRNDAKTIIKTHQMDINPDIGYENMKVVARVKDEDMRKEVENAFLENYSPDMIKAELNPLEQFDSRLSFLQGEKFKLEKTLDRLTAKLAKLERDIENLKEEM